MYRKSSHRRKMIMIIIIIIILIITIMIMIRHLFSAIFSHFQLRFYNVYYNVKH